MTNTNYHITPDFINAICVQQRIKLADLYNVLGLDKYFTITYFYKVLKGSKPINDRFESVLNAELQGFLSTSDLIKVIKIQELLK